MIYYTWTYQTKVGTSINILFHWCLSSLLYIKTLSFYIPRTRHHPSISVAGSVMVSSCSISLPLWALIFFALSLNPIEARGPVGLLTGKPPQRTASGGICASSVRIFGYKCEEHDVNMIFYYNIL